MKRFIFMVMVAMPLIGVSQEKEQRTIGEFKELKVYDLINVELIQSEENKVVITGNNTEDVICVNKNGKLKIKMNLNESFDGANTNVKLYYTTLDVIDVNEGATVKAKETIKQFEIKLNAQEGASIHVPVDVTYTLVKAVTGGKIETRGTSKKQIVALLTGGKYIGEHLLTENTEVSINAAGEAYVNASKMVDVKIKAGGDVYIYGNPETVKESNVLGGRVKLMK